MRFGSCTASVIALLAIGGPGCGKRDLQTGAGRIGVDAGGQGGSGDPGSPGDAGLPDGFRGVSGDAAPPPADYDAGNSACVTTAIPLPWTKSSSARLELNVATAGDAVAVMKRDSEMLDVRTYGRDGSVIAGFQFAADAQFVPYRDGRFQLVTRGVTGNFSVTAIDPDLVGSAPLYGGAATVTEYILGAVPLATSTLVVTDEKLANVGTGRATTWSAALGTANPFASSTLYGIATQSDRVLIAWGTNDLLRAAVLDTSGALVARLDQPGFFAGTDGHAVSAVPWGTGLLLFDGNDTNDGVRLTQIGFDLSLTALGANQQLRTYQCGMPRVAAIGLAGQLVGFWLTVFPGTDNSQGTTTHQLYGCDLDPAAPATCRRTSLIAATGLPGYGLADEPVAAAAFADGVTFAIAHTDVNGRSWLRIADLGCAEPTATP